METNNLLFLLYPTNIVLETLLGSTASYSESQGFLYASLNVVVDKSCSGFNFWLIVSSMLAFLGIQHFRGNFKKTITIPVAFIIGFFITILANTSRIYSAIIIQRQTAHTLTEYQDSIHQSIGIITNLVFLILIYYSTNRLLTQKDRYAKLT
jgi:exosortase K